jgi:hypothetical protein
MGHVHVHGMNMVGMIIITFMFMVCTRVAVCHHARLLLLLLLLRLGRLCINVHGCCSTLRDVT